MRKALSDFQIYLLENNIKISSKQDINNIIDNYMSYLKNKYIKK